MCILSASESAAMTSERPKLVLVQSIIFCSLDDKLKFKDAKMTSLRQLRWPITYKLVA